jgi:hypothetical protein
MRRSILALVMTGSLIACNSSDKKDNKYIGSLKETPIGNSGLKISIPANYTVRTKGGPDFIVYYFTPTDSTIVAPYSAGMYIGDFPTEFTATSDSCKTDSVKGQLFGTERIYKRFYCDSTYLVQIIADHNKSKLHVFGKSRSEDGIRKVLEIFSTVK